MKRSNSSRLLNACGFVAVVATALGLGTNALAQAPSTQAPPAQSDPQAKPLRGPKYFGLRYNEDWSYLEGAEDSYKPDMFDRIKNINLGGDWRLDIGGSIRFRMMNETNKNYAAYVRRGKRDSQDAFLLQQYLVHANLRYQDVFRLFIEGIHAQVTGRQTRALGIDENFYDFHQLFIDIKPFGSGTPLTLRVGRQELLYGKQRLISPLGWANTRRRFDAAKLMYKSEQWDIDGFYARPVPVNRAESLDRKLDEYNEDQHFFGVYSTYKGWDNHGLDLYYLVLLDHRPRANSAGISSNLTLHTFGSRFWGKQGPWDYEIEGAMQIGHHGGDEVFAWMVAMEGGYTFAEVPMKPRLALGFDWATGDSDPLDNQHNTFNQLFPLSHAYHGYLDQVARQNVLGPHIKLSFKPCKNVKMAIAYHHFFLDQNGDALYNAGGVPVRRDPRGNSGSAVGGEMDITTAWKIDTHQKVLFGWSHLWPGTFIDKTGDNDEVDLIYLQYVFTF